MTYVCRNIQQRNQEIPLFIASFAKLIVMLPRTDDFLSIIEYH